MTDGVVDTPGGRLAFRIDGPREAPSLLLCNALGTTLELWDAQVGALASRYRIIRYDVRGHGRSVGSVPATSLADLGQDACAVLDAVGVHAAHVAGISLGGLTALWLALHEPDRVDRLLLANTAARVGSVERWNERIELVQNGGLDVVADRAIGTWFTPPFVALEPEVTARVRQMVIACSPEAYCGCCVALREADLRSALGDVRSPTLVIAGVQDQSTTVDDARALVDGVPDAALRVLDCAHLSNVECAETFTREAEAFLTSR